MKEVRLIPDISKGFKKEILICQKENYNWDVNLRKRFRLSSSTVIEILTIIIFRVGVVRNELVVMLLCRFEFIISMLVWLFETTE